MQYIAFEWNISHTVDTVEWGRYSGYSGVDTVHTNIQWIQWRGVGESSQESLPPDSQLEHPAHLTIHFGTPAHLSGIVSTIVSHSNTYIQLEHPAHLTIHLCQKLELEV